MRRLLFALALLAAPAFAQSPVIGESVQYVFTAPSGSCSASPPVQVLFSTGVMYVCKNGTWADVTSGGSGNPGGSSTQGQYNNAGTFAGSPGLLFNLSTGYPTLMDIGSAISGNEFTMTNLSTIPTSWTLDVTSPATALADLGGAPSVAPAFTGGLTVDSPTGGNKGTGTVNVSGGYYVNGAGPQLITFGSYGCFPYYNSGHYQLNCNTHLNDNGLGITDTYPGVFSGTNYSSYLNSIVTGGTGAAGNCSIGSTWYQSITAAVYGCVQAPTPGLGARNIVGGMFSAYSQDNTLGGNYSEPVGVIGEGQVLANGGSAYGANFLAIDQIGCCTANITLAGQENDIQPSSASGPSAYFSGVGARMVLSPIGSPPTGQYPFDGFEMSTNQVGAFWRYGLNVGPGALGPNSVLFNVNAIAPATSTSGNYNCPQLFTVYQTYWNGSASVSEPWNIGCGISTGTNPTDSWFYLQTTGAPVNTQNHHFALDYFGGTYQQNTDLAFMVVSATTPTFSTIYPTATGAAKFGLSPSTGIAAVWPSVGTTNCIPKVLSGSGYTNTCSSESDNGTYLTTTEYYQLPTGSTAITQAAGDNTTSVATDAFVLANLGSAVTWPANNDIVLSNATNSPAGLAPVNGDCVVGSGGAWTAGGCTAASFGGLYGGTTTGSVNVMAATISPAPATLAAMLGVPVSFLPNLANTTTTPTVNFNSLGAETIVKCGTTALQAGDLATNAVAVVIWNGTNMQLQNPQAGICQYETPTTFTVGTILYSSNMQTSSFAGGGTFGGTNNSVSSAAGSVSFQGTTNTGTGAAGNAYLQAGKNTNATPGQQGFANVQQSFTIAAATTVGYAMAMTTTADKVQPAPLGGFNNVGIAATVGGTNAQIYVVSSGKVLTVFDGTPVVGDVACYPPASTGTIGLAHDNGSTACTLGEGLGVVTGQVSGSGSGATATVLIR
jgi:hypothetical protein